MNKDITKDTHGPWYELPVTDSVLAEATSTDIPNAVTKSPTPLKTKTIVRVPVHKIIGSSQSHKKKME